MISHTPTEPPGISTMQQARPNILGREGRWDMVDEIVAGLIVGLLLKIIDHLFGD